MDSDESDFDVGGASSDFEAPAPKATVSHNHLC
jgi:hypothetical protein